jgi:cytochrome c oxidase subunit 2
MNVPSPLVPASQQARDIDTLFQIVMAISAVIFLVVAGLVLYNAFRYRRRPGDGLPRQDFGDTKLEVAWTIIPLFIVTVMFFLSVRTMHAVDPPPLDQPPDIAIVAHQWWWEVRYPSSGAITANEIHMPTGKNLLLRVTSADVVHDFWVPQLAQKIDAIPNRMNYAWISVDRPGLYLGTCAEYCGAEHAWMRIRVVGQPPEDFARWENAQVAPAVNPGGELAAKGFALFMDLPCANCHRIAGTPADADIGPDLTHLMSRRTLAAGVFDNTPANLAKWIADPQKYKPECNMPDLQLTTEERKDLTAYLKELK